MKKATKYTYYAANLLVPLGETLRIGRAMKHAGMQLAEQARRLKLVSDKSSDEEVSFEEAVAQSGYTREVLIKRFLRAKRVWLLIFSLATLLTTALPLSLFLPDIPLAGIVRILSMMFMLAGFSGLMFVRALKNQFHLWQLQTGRLGTFAQWKNDRRWLRDTLGWTLR